MLTRPKVILQQSAIIRQHFTLSYCNTHRALHGSHNTKPCFF